MKCTHCKREIDEDETQAITGTAVVYGNQSISRFREEGIDWHVGDSDNEAVVCPYCRKLVKLT